MNNFFILSIKAIFKTILVGIFIALGLTVYSLLPNKLTSWSVFLNFYLYTLLDLFIILGFFSLIFLFTSFMKKRAKFIKVLLSSLILAVIFVGLVIPLSCKFSSKFSLPKENTSTNYLQPENNLLHVFDNFYYYTFDSNNKTITFVANPAEEPNMTIYDNSKGFMQKNNLLDDYLPKSQVLPFFSDFFKPIISSFKNFFAIGPLTFYCVAFGFFILIFSLWPTIFFTSWRLINLFLVSLFFILSTKLYEIILSSSLVKSIGEKLPAIPSYIILFSILFFIGLFLQLLGIGILKIKSLYEGNKDNV